jgi:hypothetical protein
VLTLANIGARGMDTKDIITMAISATSATISVISVLIAFRSMKRQREAQSFVVNQDILNKINNMLIADPSLFLIFGIQPSLVEKDGITMSELTYIFAQLNASSTFHQIRGKQHIELTVPRKQFLQNEKVRLAWKKYLRKHMFPESGWPDVVDAYIAALDVADLAKKDTKYLPTSEETIKEGTAKADVALQLSRAGVRLTAVLNRALGRWKADAPRR